MNNLPNLLTSLRIVLIPVFVLFFYWPSEWGIIGAALVFALAGFTDWLDGYLARRLHQSTALGAFLDPVADKLMVAVALVLLVQFYGSFWMALASLVIIAREIFISALREWMAAQQLRSKVAVGLIGKYKATAQMVAIECLIVANKDWVLLLKLGYLMLAVAVFLTLWSMLIYLKEAWPHLVSSNLS